MRPNRKSLATKEEVGIELVRLDGHISINDELLFNNVATSELDRRCRSSSCYRLENVR